MSDLNSENIENNDNQTEREKSFVPEPEIRLNTKPIPIIIVLCAASVSSVITVLQFNDFGIFFIRLVQSVVIFWIVGIVVKIILDFIFNRTKNMPVEEAEVIKKEDILLESENTQEEISENDEVEEESA